MSDPKRRYIDELMDGICCDMCSGPVSISLETAKRLKALWEYTVRLADYDTQAAQGFGVEDALDKLDEEMPEPKP